MIPLAIVNILSGKSLPIYGDGKNIRDWLYVEDHCRGIELVLKQGKPGETYNIGGENEKTNLELVHTLCNLLDKIFSEQPDLSLRFPDAPAANGKSAESPIEFITDRPGHDRRYAIDITKISSELGYRVQETFESGIQKTIQWYLDNEQWWRSVIDGNYMNWIDRHYNNA